MPGGDDSVADRVNVLLNKDWPKDTLLQFALWASPDSHADLQAMQRLRHRQVDPLLRATVEQRAAFLDAAGREAVEITLVRDFLSVITAKLPLENPTPSLRELSTAATLRASFAQALRTVGIPSQAMTADDYLRVMQSLLNWHTTSAWRDSAPVSAEPDKPLREQVWDYDNALTVDRRGLHLGDCRVNTLSFKRFPERLWFGHACAYAGDRMTGSRGLPGAFLLCEGLSARQLSQINWSQVNLDEWIGMLMLSGNMPNIPSLNLERLTGSGSTLNVDGNRQNAAARAAERLQGLDIPALRQQTLEDIAQD